MRRIALALLFLPVAAFAQDADEMVKTLKEVFKDGSEPDQIAVIQDAAKVDEAKVAKEIVRGARAQTSAVRQEALKALGQMRNKEALKQLHSIFRRAVGSSKKPSDAEFARLIRSISEHGNKSSVKILVDKPFKHLTADSGVARIMGLGNIRDKSSIEGLIKLGRLSSGGGRRGRTATDWPGIFEEAWRTAMVVLSGEDFGAAFTEWEKWWRKAKKDRKWKVSPKRPEIPNEVRGYWEAYWDQPYDPSGKTTVNTIRGNPYGRNDTPSPDEVKAAVESLDTARKAKDKEGWIAALQGAASVIDDRVVYQIAKGLHVKDRDVRIAAIDALGWMKTKDGLKQLHRMYRRNKDLHKQEEVFAALLKAIGRHGSKSSTKVLTSDVFKGLTMASGRARVLGIGRIHSKESVEILIKGTRLTGQRWGRQGFRVEEPLMPDFRVSFVTLTGLDQGLSKQAWDNWWRKNRKKLRLPDTWPPVPADVKRRWEDYWDEPYPGGER